MSGASSYPEPATGIALTKMVADTKAELLWRLCRSRHRGR
jgi:hypothetical protein